MSLPFDLTHIGDFCDDGSKCRAELLQRWLRFDANEPFQDWIELERDEHLPTRRAAIETCAWHPQLVGPTIEDYAAAEVFRLHPNNRNSVAIPPLDEPLRQRKPVDP